MSDHWRLALWYAVWMFVLAIPAGAGVFYVYGGAHAGALLYGVGTGTLSFVSMAFTVSLLTGHSYLGRVLGVATFVVRYAFVAVALGVPAYLGLWPVVAMLCGFVGVYLAENAVLLPRVLVVKRSSPSMRRNAGRSVGERWNGG